MPPTEQSTESTEAAEARRYGALETEYETPSEPTDKPLVARVPGDDPSKFVTLTLSNPLNERDRVMLGLPKDGKTEVGQQVKVNRNGAKSLIAAGYATVDPEDREAVREALRVPSGDTVPKGEPTADPQVEAQQTPLANPPQAQSTPGSTVDPAVGEGDQKAEGDDPKAADATSAPAESTASGKGSRGSR